MADDVPDGLPEQKGEHPPDVEEPERPHQERVDDQEVSVGDVEIVLEDVEARDRTEAEPKSREDPVGRDAPSEHRAVHDLGGEHQSELEVVKGPLALLSEPHETEVGVEREEAEVGRAPAESVAEEAVGENVEVPREVPDLRDIFPKEETRRDKDVLGPEPETVA